MNKYIYLNNEKVFIEELEQRLIQCADENVKNVSVELDEGQYIIDRTIHLTNEYLKNIDSINFICKGEKPAEICGWVKVENFKETTVNGFKAWAADIPTVNGEKLYSHQFFSAEGKRLTRPRFPKNGYLYGKSVPQYENSKNPFHDSGINNGIPITENRTDAFYFHENHIPKLSRFGDIQMRMYHYWVMENMTVKDIDYNKNLITFTGPSLYRLGSECSDANEIELSGRFFLDNVFEMLGISGQVYEDRESGQIFYIPNENEEIEDFFIYASNIEQLLEIDGLSNIKFENISFVGSDWKETERHKYSIAAQQAAADLKNPAVSLNNVSNIVFKSCNFEHIGNYALCGDKAISDLTIDNCVFRDIGAGGIWIKGVSVERLENGEYPTNVPRNIHITNCTVSNFGIIFADATGIFFQYAYDVLISHNEVCHAPYSGIHLGWSWSPEYKIHPAGFTVEKNHVYDIGMGMMSDAGGIYTNGVLENTIITGNVVHDVEMVKGGYGGWGIYTDAFTGGMTIENNIVYDCSQESFNSSQGNGNIVRNNIFAFGETGAMSDRSSDGNCAFSLERNIIVTNFAPVYRFNPANKKETNFTDDSNLIWDYTLQSAYSCIEGDLNCIGTVEEIRAKVDENIRYNKSCGYYKNVLIKDPLFVDAEKRNFTLSENSPAFEIGFKPIDISDVGPRKNK